MAEETKPGFLEGVKRKVAERAGRMKAHAAAVLRERAAEIREAIGPEKAEPIKEPARPFGRDEGGDDVKRIVWTGHTVRTAEGEAYYGAVGLTQSGYYRAAEVQVYGAAESWRWQQERHTDKEHAVASAESMSDYRLRGEDVPPAEPAWREFFGKEPIMAEIPEDVKAKADAASQGITQKMGRLPQQDINTEQAVENYGDGGRELDAMREQKRQEALQEKNQQPERG